MSETATLKRTDIVSASTHNIVSDMGGEKVMLSVENGNYYNLGVIGGHIWDQLAHPVSVESLVDALLKEYDVERGQCEAHVIAFLGHLRKEGLILVHETDSSLARA